MKKIFVVTQSLTKEGFTKKVLDFECKETANGYIVNKPSGFGGKTTRLKKEDILKIDSKVTENLYYFISFYTWCFEDQLSMAKEIVFNKLFETSKKQKEISEKMFSLLKQEGHPKE